MAMTTWSSENSDCLCKHFVLHLSSTRCVLGTCESLCVSYSKLIKTSPYDFKSYNLAACDLEIWTFWIKSIENYNMHII